MESFRQRAALSRKTCTARRHVRQPEKPIWPLAAARTRMQPPWLQSSPSSTRRKYEEASRCEGWVAYLLSGRTVTCVFAAKRAVRPRKNTGLLRRSGRNPMGLCAGKSRRSDGASVRYAAKRLRRVRTTSHGAHLQESNLSRIYGSDFFETETSCAGRRVPWSARANCARGSRRHDQDCF